MTPRGAHVPLAALPTPLLDAPRLAAAAGVGRLLVKRDDLTGFALGGTDVRKLERLAAEMAARGCDTVVTGGPADAGHLAPTAAVAARLGLACRLVVAVPAGGPPPATPGLAFAAALGADVEPVGAAGFLETEWSIERVATRLAVVDGRRPFVVPVGAATVNGALGVAGGARELLGQLAAAGTGADLVVVPSATGATAAGVVAGLGACTEAPPAVLAVDLGRRPDLPVALEQLVVLVAGLLGAPVPDGSRWRVLRAPADGDGALAARGARLAARTEGLALDAGTARALLASSGDGGRVDADGGHGAACVVLWQAGEAGHPALDVTPR